MPAHADSLASDLDAQYIKLRDTIDPNVAANILTRYPGAAKLAIALRDRLRFTDLGSMRNIASEGGIGLRNPNRLVTYRGEKCVFKSPNQPGRGP